MTFSKKIKTIHDKTERTKAQYDLDRQNSKISVLLLGNVNKYKSVIGKDVLREKYLSKKAATIFDNLWQDLNIHH